MHRLVVSVVADSVRRVENTRDTRDFRVLEAIVDITDRGGTNSVTAESIASHSGLDATTVQAAPRALNSEDPPFFEAQASWGGGILRASNPTGHARRAVGAWPTAASLANQLIAKIESAAAGESDEGKRSKLNQLAGFFATGGRDLLVDIAAKSKAITGA